ncbi:uncharacterized protein BO88DRAFT_327846, partial [Aspergillus vadensis CBS 113365]
TSSSTEQPSVTTQTCRKPANDHTPQLPYTTTNRAKTKRQETPKTKTQRRTEPPATMRETGNYRKPELSIGGAKIYRPARKVSRPKQDKKDNSLDSKTHTPQTQERTDPQRNPKSPRNRTSKKNSETETPKPRTTNETRHKTTQIDKTEPGNKHMKTPKRENSAKTNGSKQTTNQQDDGPQTQAAQTTKKKNLTNNTTMTQKPEQITPRPQKHHRPHNHPTPVEEDSKTTQTTLAEQYQNQNQTTSQNPAQHMTQNNQHHMARKTTHPTKRLHEPEEGHDGKHAMTQQNNRKKPTHTQKQSNVQAPNQDQTQQTLPQNAPSQHASEAADHDQHQPATGHLKLSETPTNNTTTNRPPQPTNKNKGMDNNLEKNRDNNNINGPTSTRNRNARHTAKRRPLTPGRQSTTTTRKATTPKRDRVSTDQPRRTRRKVAPAGRTRQKINSPTRSGRRDQIKQGKIRRKPKARTASTPNAPEHKTLSQEPPPVYDTQTSRNPTNSVPTSASASGHMPKRKPRTHNPNGTQTSSGEHPRTPAKRPETAKTTATAAPIRSRRDETETNAPAHTATPTETDRSIPGTAEPRSTEDNRTKTHGIKPKSAHCPTRVIKR